MEERPPSHRRFWLAVAGGDSTVESSFTSRAEKRFKSREPYSAVDFGTSNSFFVAEDNAFAFAGRCPSTG